MLLTLFSKVFGTSVGLLAARALPDNPASVAAVLGVAPIWLEVVATLVSGREPSLETRPLWRRLDALVDALSFVLVPAAWLWLRFPEPVLAAGLLVFVTCGLFRLGRFLRRGLVNGQHFEGLPVTYTGYAWFLCAFSLSHGQVWLPTLTLCVLAFLMVWTRLKVRRTQTRNDTPPVD